MRYSSHILNLISWKVENIDNNQNIFDYTENYPFRLGNRKKNPTANDGCVYCLVSLSNKDSIFIGKKILRSDIDSVQ